MAGAWTKITVTGKTGDLDEIVAVMSMLDNGLMIEDFSDFSLNGMYGELVDDTILNADRETVKVSLFVPEERSFLEYTTFLEARLPALGIEAKIEVEGINEEDWAENWKQYYKPVPLGKITVVPAWEKYEAQDDEITVTMDPGMAFGTGPHETTRLIIGLLQKYVKDGLTLLDVGTGSGILAICGAKLGAVDCRAYDIDPMSVRVANENIRESGLADKIECEQSDLLKQAKNIAGGYDIICANIVADIIIRMTPDVSPFMSEKTVLLASGIISERCDDVVECFDKNGFKIIERAEDNGWCALAVMLG